MGGSRDGSVSRPSPSRPPCTPHFHIVVHTIVVQTERDALPQKKKKKMMKKKMKKKKKKRARAFSLEPPSLKPPTLPNLQPKMAKTKGASWGWGWEGGSDRGGSRNAAAGGRERRRSRRSLKHLSFFSLKFSTFQLSIFFQSSKQKNISIQAAAARALSFCSCFSFFFFAFLLCVVCAVQCSAVSCLRLRPK
jgi:hypothetical protein